MFRTSSVITYSVSRTFLSLSVLDNKIRLLNSPYRVLEFVKDSLDILSGGKFSMRRNDVFFVKSGNDSHLVTSWRFSLQSKLGARPHSAAIVRVQTETENFQIHSLGRVESPQVLSYLSTRRYGFANNRARIRYRI